MHEDADSTVDVEAPAHAVEGECFATTSFRVGAFYCQIDAVIQRLACRFVKHIGDLFGFLYKYKTMTEVDLKLSYDRFSAAYFEDVSNELSKEALMLLIKIRSVASVRRYLSSRSRYMQPTPSF